MRSSLPFSSFLLYHPRPRSETARLVKNFVLQLKQDRVLPGVRLRASVYLARRMEDLLPEDHDIRRLLAGAHLVPVPGSTPLVGGALRASERLADALSREDLGGPVVPLLDRTTAVRQSHRSAGGDRPWPDTHRRSLEVHRLLPIGFDGKLVLVDDVVTRGSTLLGCAQRIEEAYPHAELAGFVAARTAKPDTVDQGLSTDPRSGAITFREGWLERDP